MRHRCEQGPRPSFFSHGLEADGAGGVGGGLEERTEGNIQRKRSLNKQAENVTGNWTEKLCSATLETSPPLL